VFSASPAGLLAYEAGAATGGEQLTWFDRSGQTVGMLGNVGYFSSLDLSPDGKSVVVTNNGNLWLHDVSRGLATRFTFGAVLNVSGFWSPDGRYIVYASDAKGQRDLYRKAADGSKGEELLYADGAAKIATSWSPDSQFLLFFRFDLKTQRDLWVLPLGAHSGPGSLKPFPWFATRFNEFFAKYSPDGRWVAYQSDESGRNEIYVAPFPGPGGKHQISADGGSYPRWRADGKEIFYIGSTGTLMAAEVSLRLDNIEIGAVHSLRIPVIANRYYLYDVSADGQRFLVAVPQGHKSSVALTLVQNWTALLKKN
jgi:hypothetical protein